MEKIAVQRDFRVLGTELAQKSENGHKQIMERWRIVSNPKTAREDFQATYAPENLPKARVMDTVMESLVKTQCRRLSDYAKGNATPAEKLYFSRRQECLKAVYKEHMLHLSQALGQNQAQEKGKDRSLSRWASSDEKQDGQCNRYGHITLLTRILPWSSDRDSCKQKTGKILH